jgi:tetratricopeptide (TPR) repeat protein
LVDVFVGVGGISALLFVTKSVFDFDIIAKVFGANAWNAFDNLNSAFGVFLISVFIVSAGQIMQKGLNIIRTVLYCAVSALCFWVLVLLSFKVLWWVLLVGLLFLLLVGVNFLKETRNGWLSILFLTLIFVIVFIIFGTPKSFQEAVPSEVALGKGPSWEVSKDTIFSSAKKLFLGSGLGTFGVDFSKFRPEKFNLDPNVWTMRFTQPFNTALSLLAEGGITVFLSMIFLVLFLLGYVFQILLKLRSNRLTRGFVSLKPDASENFIEVFVVAAAGVVVGLSSFFVYFGPTLWWVWWLLIGLTVSGCAFLSHGFIKEKSWKIEDTPEHGLSFSFSMIVVMALLVMTVVLGVRVYLSDVEYVKAKNANDNNRSETYLLSAINKRSNMDLYHVAMAQVYLGKAIELSKQASPDIQAISALMAKAVNESRVATELSPNSVGIWENLATMYENASVIVADARDWSIKSLESAKELEPSNPALWWRLGNAYSLSGKLEEAVKSYEESARLKPDYIGAYMGLANTYEQKQQIGKAVETYEKVLVANQNNPEFLYNYGRLLYNRNSRNDRDSALKIWNRVLELQPNYSNALYSIGLLYETRGDKATALKYYYKVKDLNPNNQDILNKIKSLMGGAPAQTSQTINKK